MENIYEIDKPIDDIGKDDLNRSKFVEILSNSIIQYNNPECLVIGLMGEWGCGKSSIINMVFNNIDEFNENKPDEEKWLKIKFNPWYFSNRDTILIHFFDTLKESCHNPQVKVEIFKYLSQFKDKICQDISFTLENENFNFDYSNQNNDFEIYDSFNSLKDNLIELFQQLNFKIVISIDDIDRLTDEEMRQIFLLVKALADFPNIIYILSFDKYVALKALNNLQVYSPEKFLEKIIQIPINVPEITNSRLELLIKEKIKPIYEDNLKFSKNNFFKIFYHIKPFFTNVRDLKRYSNVLNFYLNQFKDEVNIGDFLLIIAIQLFEEELYERIKNNKELLTNYELFDNVDEKERSKIYNDFLDGITGLKKYEPNKIKELMGYLFPILNNFDFDSKEYYENMFGANLNIASNLHFDKYFTLSTEENEVSQIIIDELLESKNVENNSQIMLNLINNDKTVSLLDKLERNAHRMDMEDMNYLIEPLLLIGDSTKYISKLYHLIDLLFGYQFDGNKSYNIMKNMLIDSNSFFTSCYCLDKIGDDYGLYYGTNSKSKNLPYIEPDEFKELISIAYNKLKNLAYNGILLNNPYFKYFLDFWKAWGTKKEVEQFIETNINESNIMQFIKKFKIDSDIILVDENEKFEDDDIFDFERLYDYVHPDEIYVLVKEAISQKGISNEDYELGKLLLKECEYECC